MSGEERTDVAPRGEADATRAAARVLSTFFPTTRATATAAVLGRAADPVAAAVRLLRAEVEASDEAVAAALDEAGIAAPRIAALLGTDVLRVNRWLDDPLLLVPADLTAVGPPTHLRIARAVVRAIWVTLGVLAVAVIVDARGGVVPCPTDLCIDGVDLLLADGSAVPATTRSVFEPTEVVGVRFEHRATGARPVTVQWSVDGDLLESVLVRFTDAGRTTVESPSGRLPAGVHVVDLLDPVPGGSATFVVE